MKFAFFILLILLLSNCSKSKTVLICGNHVCVNKAEAEQFFEDNLSIEVKIVNDKITREVDLVELNLKENTSGKKEIYLSSKRRTNEKLRILSDEEINIIKQNVTSKNKKKKSVKKTKKNNYNKNDIKKNQPYIDTTNINSSANKNDVFDACTILEKCNIDEISKYLLKKGKEKNFPDITLR